VTWIRERDSSGRLIGVRPASAGVPGHGLRFACMYVCSRFDYISWRRAFSLLLFLSSAPSLPSPIVHAYEGMLFHIHVRNAGSARGVPNLFARGRISGCVTSTGTSMGNRRSSQSRQGPYAKHMERKRSTRRPWLTLPTYRAFYFVTCCYRAINSGPARPPSTPSLSPALVSHFCKPAGITSRDARNRAKWRLIARPRACTRSSFIRVRWVRPSFYPRPVYHGLRGDYSRSSLDHCCHYIGNDIHHCLFLIKCLSISAGNRGIYLLNFNDRLIPMKRKSDSYWKEISRGKLSSRITFHALR